jgi:organic hydroperoxide reductase OsmC/OhrA
MFAAALAACYSTPVLRFVRDVRRRVRDFWCWRPDET